MTEHFWELFNVCTQATFSNNKIRFANLLYFHVEKPPLHINMFTAVSFPAEFPCSSLHSSHPYPSSTAFATG